MLLLLFFVVVDVVVGGGVVVDGGVGVVGMFLCSATVAFFAAKFFSVSKAEFGFYPWGPTFLPYFPGDVCEFC